MKRNEKIEIRVSLDEKTRLSELAQQEGESVSGLIRGLVGKYVALNSPSTKRRLPKWQMAALLLIAALIGHGLTLVPIHLHQIGHQTAAAEAPVFYVHGAIGNSAFGTTVTLDKPMQELSIDVEDAGEQTVRLTFAESPDDAGLLTVSICEPQSADQCSPVFEKNMSIGRVAPSVMGDTTQTGVPLYIFVQEMA